MTTCWTRGVIRAGDGRIAPTVLKWGGSLLMRPSWPVDLQQLLESLAGPVTIVVGGGAVVDGLRSIDASCPRPAPLMHRLAIDAMGLTARLVADAASLRVVAEPPGLGAAILDVPNWLTTTTRGSELPASWHVTSDSIAARVALASRAVLVLAKSIPPPADRLTLEALAGSGWVDGHFPIAAGALDRIEWAAVSPRNSR